LQGTKIAAITRVNNGGVYGLKTLQAMNTAPMFLSLAVALGWPVDLCF